MRAGQPGARMALRGGRSALLFPLNSYQLCCFFFFLSSVFVCCSDANYDSATNFNDFSSFAGWSRPNMKQFATGSMCGASVDLNWY